MKKLLIISSFYLVLISCNSNTSANGAAATDSTGAGLTSPAAIDSTASANGMTNSSVISTDTAAMNTNNAINKAKDSLRK